MKKILVTGSSGYVAADLIPRLKTIAEVIGVDLVPSIHTDFVVDIASKEFEDIANSLLDDEIYIVNLAAARFDFGACAEDYLRLNVLCHESFLLFLSKLKIKKFVHISSVAAIDGRKIKYKSDLNCDDAYRSTKHIQENSIREWCHKRKIDLSVLYPSAIFSNNARQDTNIGKMQIFSKFIPFVPEINVKKSLTFLPNLSMFIVKNITGNFSPGLYLTIERPIMSVTQMIIILSGRNLIKIRILGLKQILKIIAWNLFIIGFGKIDFKLTPNRVEKLFSDTSYDDCFEEDIDCDIYNQQSHDDLIKLLMGYNKNILK